jgi:hypothetical protein
VGYRLLSEGLVIGATFGATAFLTFTLARRASGSLALGIVAAALQIAIAPRTYSYPKLLISAAGLLFLWRYIDRPTPRRAATLGAVIAGAFLLRHDLGAYLGLTAVAIVAVHHGRSWRTSLGRTAIMTASFLVLVAPFLVYVQVNRGLGAYVREIRSLATREYQQSRLEQWPRWPLSRAEGVVRGAPTGSSAVIGVRWSPDAPDAIRRKVATQHGVPVAAERPVESGPYLLTNTAQENVLAFIRNPAVEDTSGLDRKSGLVHVPGLRAAGMHLLPALDPKPASAALLFYVGGVLLVGTLLVLAFNRQRERSERLKMFAVVLMGLATSIGFLREPLDARIGDAVVPPLVLGAWWGGHAVRRRQSLWEQTAAVSAAVLIAAPVLRSISVIGDVGPRLQHVRAWSEVRSHLTTSPPFEAVPASNTAKYKVIRYVRACTGNDEPLLVLGFAPDIYYYADRPFAGRLGFYMEGYWTSASDQRMNMRAIDRERPLLAILEAGREVTDLYTYPWMLAYLGEHYRELGEVSGSDGSSIRVFARNDRPPASHDAELGWACFR